MSRRFKPGAEGKILVCGSIAQDYILQTSANFHEALHLDSQGLNGSLVAPVLEIRRGGTGGNIAYNASLFEGLGITLAASVGSDFKGSEYERELLRQGIELKLYRINDVSTATCFIFNDPVRSQIIIMHPGAMDRAGEKTLGELEVQLAEYEWSINSPNGPAAMVRWSQELREVGVKMVFDPGQNVHRFEKEQLDQTLPECDIFISNRFELRQACRVLGEITVEELLSMVPGPVITTLGKDGAVIREAGKDDVQIRPCVTRNVVDTTGVGDGFRGAMMAGLSGGMTLEEACRLGSAMGAAITAGSGAQFLENLQTVREMYQSQYGPWPLETEG